MNVSKIIWYIAVSYLIQMGLIFATYITASNIDAIAKWPSAIGNVTTLWCIILTIASLAFPIVSVWYGVYLLLNTQEK